MKVIKLAPQQALWTFCQQHCPPSLRAIRHGQGYGYVYGLIYKEESSLNLLSVDWVATVTGNTMEVFKPQYYSDCEALCMQYEAATHREVTLKFWESA